uniref:Uncharacterized protein n=1 Tax=Oryza barthii TaxID=65489 RepID=A0A0D3F3S5_9ORYZ
MEKVLIKIFRKEVVNEMKKKLINSASKVVRKHKAKKAKGLAQSDGSFSRFSATYFSKVVSSLSPH